MSAEKMVAAQYATSGPRSGVIELVDLPRPSPAAGDVLVRVRLYGVNPTDVRSQEGRSFNPPYERVVPGQDGAGEIVAVGAGVAPSRVGERVWLYFCQWQRPQGAAAQWIALPSEQAVALPDGASLALGAGLGIPALTAHRCLHAFGPIAGASVLVAGGAGAVGHAAIELARHGGARVASSVSSEQKARIAAAAGAELVVDYTRGRAADEIGAWAPDGVQRIVEVAIATNIALDTEVIAPGHEIASYGAPTAPIEIPRSLIAKNALVRFVLVYTMPEQAQRDAVAGVGEALGAGALTALPELRFPLERVQEAHDAVREHAVAKVLVEIP
ncbi:MAG TPA: NADPH:quinone reductase [Solirubrobacteraceae bacterium]|nr:NADPH:quinone reductase [Solirubrobacteraceae bacterium]